MAQIEKIVIRGYRSVEEAEVCFPENAPLILIGENNAGKSNIARAIDLILGEFWPGNHEPQDNEFYLRDRESRISVEAHFSVPLGRYDSVRWIYDSSQDPEVEFRGSDEWRDDGFISGNDRNELIAVTIGADRRLSYQLSYTSKYTMLSRLMHRFHKAMQENADVRQRLENVFQQTKEIFDEVEEFSNFRHSLREDFADLIQSMTHRLEVDFEAYNPVNFFHALRLHADEGGEPRTLEELGTGEEQMLALAFAHAYAKAFHGGILLAIEEPEAHLHPLAQEWLARKIRGLARDGLQIVLTTHSPAFVDLLNIEGLALVLKEPGNGTRVIQRDLDYLVGWCEVHGVPSGRVQRGSIQDFYDANSTREIKEGFFAKRIVLVEGPTESLSLPVYLAAVDLDCSAEGVAIIPVGGKGNLAKWWRLFTAYEIPTYVIFDNAIGEDSEGNRRTDILSTLGEDEIEAILERTDFHITDKFAVFGTDFEVCLRQLFPQYSQTEAQAREYLSSDSKPMIARHVARELAQTDVSGEPWDKVRDLAEHIRQVALP
ncbi:AAA family ATPase [Acidobacteria bacterium AH-259-L09]|nr:AAA family ATPase [Acidobacteria bacterium AH-259-L09]